MLIGQDGRFDQIFEGLHVANADGDGRRRDPRKLNAVEKRTVPGRDVSRADLVDVDPQNLSGRAGIHALEKRVERRVRVDRVWSARIVAMIEVPFETMIYFVACNESSGHRREGRIRRLYCRLLLLPLDHL